MDTDRGEMARRWLDFCQEHQIDSALASSLLDRARGQYKNAMRLFETEQPLS